MESKAEPQTCWEKTLAILDPIFKGISAGGVENGIYFEKKKQHFTMCTGIFTLLGACIVIGSTAKIYTDIFKEVVIVPNIKYSADPVDSYKVQFMDFYKQTNLSFEVITKDFWNDATYSVTCNDFDIKMMYSLNSAKTNTIPIPIDCKIKDPSSSKTSVILQLIVTDERFKDLIISKSHLFYLEISYITANANKFIKPFLMYNGNTIQFTGTATKPDKYGSIELPFGFFYKA